MHKALKAGKEPAQVTQAASSTPAVAPATPAVGSDYFAQKTRDWYTPFPRQREFHDSPAKYRLFGGAAGPGKTKALLMEAIRQANTYPKVDTLLMRRTFPELEKSLLTYFRRDVPRDAYKSYNDSKHIVTWHNGSTTHFGYSAFEHDIYQYQGAEFFFIGIDELTHFTLGQWQFLTSRNRSACKEAQPNMAGASNPGNIGHAWVKALWVDRRAPAGMEEPERYDPYDYAFIRATLDDNPIYRNDADYRKTLEALPRHLRQAFLYGDWNVYAGQYFDIFDLRVHTARAEELGIEPWWPRWISIDWGFEHPSAVYWHAARPDGAVITYREFVANHLSPRMLAQAIAERSVSTPESSTYRGAWSRREDPHVSQTETWGTQDRASGAFAEGDGFSSTGIPACAPFADDNFVNRYARGTRPNDPAAPNYDPAAARSDAASGSDPAVARVFRAGAPAPDRGPEAFAARGNKAARDLLLIFAVARVFRAGALRPIGDPRPFRPARRQVRIAQRRAQVRASHATRGLSNQQWFQRACDFFLAYGCKRLRALR